MFITKLKSATLVFLTLALLGSGIGMLALPAVAEQEGAKNGVVEPPVQKTKTPRPDLSKAQFQPEAKTDKELLQGTWTLVETHKHGKKLAAKDNVYRPHNLAITGNKIVEQFIEGGKSEGTFELDSAKKLKEITITWFPPQWHAIYKLEGDTLTICWNDVKNYIRPDEFHTAADSERMLRVYKRAKPNQEPKKDKEPDLERIQGTWSLVSQELNGEQPENVVKRLWAFKDGMATVSWERKPKADVPTDKGNKGKVELTFTIDPSKTPKEISFSGDSVKLLMIYKFEKDTLTLCYFGKAELARPKGFTVKDAGLGDSNTNLIVEVFKKEKAKAVEGEKQGKEFPDLSKTQFQPEVKTDKEILQGT